MAATETSLLTQIERVPVDELVLYPGNPRRGDLDAIAESMATNAQYEPLVVQASTRRVLAGNHRLLAAQSLGWETIDVVVVDVDDDHARRIMLSSNRTSELGSFDEELLVTQLGALRELAGTGFGANDLVELESRLEALRRLENPADPDEVPPVPVEAFSERGCIYELGEHRLMCGDATNAEDVVKLLDGERAALLFTSPPYLDAREYGGDQDLAVDHLAEFLPRFADYADLLCVNLGIVRRDGAVVRFWDAYIAAAEEAGLRLLSWNVWDREQPASIAQHTAMFPIEHEFVLVFGEHTRPLAETVANKRPGVETGRTNRQTNGTLKRAKRSVVREFRPLGTVVRSPWHIGPDFGHPAMFPSALPEAYIEAATDSGEIVADPFVGSVTTLIAAEKLGRRCFACDIDPLYVDVCRQRFADYVGRPDLAPGAET